MGKSSHTKTQQVTTKCEVCAYCWGCYFDTAFHLSSKLSLYNSVLSQLCLWLIDLFYCVYIISYWWFQIIYCHTIRASSRLPKASRDIFLAKPHYSDVIMSAMAPQITGVSIVYSTVYSCTDQRNHQSSASLAWWPVNSLHEGPVTRKKFSWISRPASRFPDYFRIESRLLIWRSSEWRIRNLAETPFLTSTILP